MTEELLPPWDAYSRLQKRATKTFRIDSGSWGLEKEMNLFLDNPEAYAHAKNEVQLKKDGASAARRERAQAQMRKKHPDKLVSEPVNPVPQLEARETLQLIQGSLTPAAWDVLLGIGRGHTHNELASEAGIKPGTMRVLVSRLRAQVAHHYAA